MTTPHTPYLTVPSKTAQLSNISSHDMSAQRPITSLQVFSTIPDQTSLYQLIIECCRCNRQPTSSIPTLSYNSPRCPYSSTVRSMVACPLWVFSLATLLQVFNNTPDETGFYRMTLEREGVAGSLLMIQPTLFSFSFDGPPQPVLLDVASMRYTTPPPPPPPPLAIPAGCILQGTGSVRHACWFLCMGHSCRVWSL